MLLLLLLKFVDVLVALFFFAWIYVEFVTPGTRTAEFEMPCFCSCGRLLALSLMSLPRIARRGESRTDGQAGQEGFWRTIAVFLFLLRLGIRPRTPKVNDVFKGLRRRLGRPPVADTRYAHIITRRGGLGSDSMPRD